MLPELLRREWILHRTTILLMFAIFGAYQIYAMISMDSSRGWVVMATIYAAGLTLAIFVREDKFRATAWSCSLPVSRRELVRARFVFAWLMVLAALTFSTLMTMVVPGSNVSASEVVQPTTLLIVAGIASRVWRGRKLTALLAPTPPGSLGTPDSARRLQELILIAFFAAATALVLKWGLKHDAWSFFQARLVFPTFLSIGVALGWGVELVERRPLARYAVNLSMGALILLVSLYFGVELGAAAGLIGG